MHIPIAQRVTAVIFSLILVLVIVQLIRKQKLREEYALAWLGASLIILLLSVFGGLIKILAALFAVSYAPTLALVLGLLFVLVVLLSQSVALSSQADCIRDLAQQVTLLEWRVRQLETSHLQIADGAANKPYNGDQAAPNGSPIAIGTSPCGTDTSPCGKTSEAFEPSQVLAGTGTSPKGGGS